MTTLDGIDLDGLTAKAAQIRFWTTVARLLAWLCLGAGKLLWLEYKGLRIAWLAPCWVFVVVRQGWRDAKEADRQKHLAKQAAARSLYG